MGVGRPSIYSDAIADDICGRIADGESLRSICGDAYMPSRRTVLHWLDDDAHADFCAKYARARELQADLLAAEIVEIADTPEIGTKSVLKPTGTEITEGDMVEHRRLRILARQWYAAKLAPKKYGDKIQQEVTGPNGGPIKVQSARDMTDDELAAIASASSK